MNLKLIAISIGAGLFITGAIIALDLSTQGEFDSLFAVLFLPATLIRLLFGPGPNIGTDEEPRYEVTPVHFVLFAMAVFLTTAMYSILTYALLRFIAWRRRSPSQTG